MEPASLLTMPDEILVKICEDLCCHCSAVTTETWDFRKCSKSAFSSLIQTCRRLRDVVQPVQYHEVFPSDFRPLLRTIIARPDLAARVRRFYIIDMMNSEFSAEDVEMLRAEARRHKIGKCDEWLQTIKDHEYDSQLRLLELTLARLPKLETLYIQEPGRYRTKLNVSLKALTEMPSITNLELCIHENTDLGRMHDFISMLPRLEKLTVELCGKISQHLPLSELRSVVLCESYISVASLQNLVSSCPKLEHFEYYDGDLGLSVEDESQMDFASFTWGQAQRILHARRETLKALNFEFGPDYLAIPREPLGEDDYLHSFHDFDKLETLWVRTTSFGTDDDEKDVPLFPQDVQELVKMLPPSLICLGFSGSHKNWDGVKTLANAIRGGHFQRLKKVVLEQEQAEFQKSCEILAAVGVVCKQFEMGRYWYFPHEDHHEELSMTKRYLH
ncbi:hypothetical protein Trihar35433_9561 [Trichoderma harzianum]|nr:hypothetical protein Trihar35433_9561 [Trichoderma harzianum]